MPAESAGVLLYLVSAPAVRVFLAHMGGPFWQRRGAGAWTIPKGEFTPGAEDPALAAAREFEEEIGVPCPGPLEPLGDFQQSRAKRIHVFVAESGVSLTFVGSNDFEMEWPKGSGVIRSFPEVDRAMWFDVAEARRLVVTGQIQVLDALMERLRRERGNALTEGSPDGGGVQG